MDWNQTRAEVYEIVNGELSLNLCDRKIRHARLKIDTGYWYADRDKTC